MSERAHTDRPVAATTDGSPDTANDMQFLREWRSCVVDMVATFTDDRGPLRRALVAFIDGTSR